MWRDLARWHGLALIAVTIVVSLWLATTGQLIFYIHPRYVVFTVTMALIGLAFVIASFTRIGRDGDGHTHAHSHEHGLPELGIAGLENVESSSHGDPEAGSMRPRSSRRRRSVAAITGVGTFVTLALAATLIVLPPATLSSATASQREINSSGVDTSTELLDDAEDSSASVASFTVLDWASILRQTSDPAFYAGKTAEVVGFVTEDADDPDNVFYVSRFIITCCAVDAQPIGVPVYLENWKSELAIDQWVTVTGEFEINPSPSSSESVALVPVEVVPTDQPSEPYLF
ncbi:TIGR03943 family putative permease subunit [Marisediminicola sp. LYQ134]|uniref:TIGR03943 family putative permease subunit n=1 Tax=unclassified Marisediminicola TaxID=2618316 RepID=UPI0039839A46